MFKCGKDVIYYCFNEKKAVINYQMFLTNLLLHIHMHIYIYPRFRRISQVDYHLSGYADEMACVEGYIFYVAFVDVRNIVSRRKAINTASEIDHNLSISHSVL